ncbi:hypothetical protein [Streptomyces sp. NPDC005231]|uniref:ISAzo13-like element transposase-related protein n=1 Tax=Streptomyces sp. NPDC005231 TaxID=3157026 RepID=UPI0033B07AE2
MPDRHHHATRRQQRHRPGPHLVRQGPQTHPTQCGPLARRHPAEDPQVPDRAGGEGPPETRQRHPPTARGRPLPQTAQLAVLLPAEGQTESPTTPRTRQVHHTAGDDSSVVKQRHWPGTSKWNKVEHRLFSAITMNWRGRPMNSHEVVVQSIAATTTRTGLTVHAELDTRAYPTGVKVSDAELNAVPVTGHSFHGE